MKTITHVKGLIPCSRHQAAWHEAGHAVVVAACGGCVWHAWIKNGRRPSSWTGRIGYDHDDRLLGPVWDVPELCVAIAGSLANIMQGDSPADVVWLDKLELQEAADVATRLADAAELCPNDVAQWARNFVAYTLLKEDLAVEGFARALEKSRDICWPQTVRLLRDVEPLGVVAIFERHFGRNLPRPSISEAIAMRRQSEEMA